MSQSSPSRMVEGKVVVVTGAGGGIGRDIALAMAREGARLVVNDIGASVAGEGNDAGPAQKVVDEIRALGGEAVANTDSVSEALSAGRIVQTALDTFGRIDVVVNNAGILRDRFFHKMSLDEWDAVIKVHLYGAYYVSRAASTHFKEQGSGNYIHMTSTSGLIGNFGQANYSAAKLGIAALSKSIALDMQKFNVRSNCIAPFAWSRMIDSMPSDTPEQVARLAHGQGLRFGFGGIARLDEGLLPGRDVLAEHLRLGSGAVILSRTFHAAGGGAQFEQDVAALRAAEARLAHRSAHEIEQDRMRIAARILEIAAGLAPQA